MKKPLLALTIVGAIIASSTTVAYADAVNYTKYSYSQKVATDNYELNKINDDLEDEYDDYILALRASHTITEMDWDEFEDNYDAQASRLAATQTKLYNHLAEGKEYHDKFVEQKKKEDEIELTAESNYFNYINAEKSLKNAIDAFNLTKTTYETKKLEHELGKISDIDLLTFEKSYNDSFVAQLQASNAFESAENTFNQYASQPINTEVSLQDADIILPEYKLNSLTDTYATLLENSYQMSALTLELERLEMDRTLKGRFSGNSAYYSTLENLDISIKDTKEQIDDMKLDLDYQLRTKYNDTLSADNTFKSAELTLEIEQNNYNVAKIKSDNQMIRDLDFNQSQQSYDNALNNYFDAKLAAYKAIKTFNNFIELNSTSINMEFN
jgi:hypothetical protein